LGTNQMRQVPLLIRNALSIPVYANGNILYREHVDTCLEVTGCDGVMTAEGNLNNPCLFTGKYYKCTTVAQEYLDICREVPNSAEAYMAKAHLFKMFHALYTS
jgi:tRNA-dihydrouridine synthase 1